jgi:signal transduction histidine kinase
MNSARVLVEELQRETLPAEVADKLGVLWDTMLVGMEDVRFAVLTWNSLEWGGSLRTHAERFTREFSAVSGIPVELDVSGSGPAPDADTVDDFMRVLREALSNVWRHARATSVLVEVVFESEGVGLTVSDNGIGFDPAACEGAGTGLACILARGRRGGGTAGIDAAPGKGTRIRAWMPCG